MCPDIPAAGARSAREEKIGAPLEYWAAVPV
jgi:hypothetical protein